MKFQFKIQQYQTDAVDSTVQVFSGQPNQGLQEYVLDKGKLFVKSKGTLHELNDLSLMEHGYSNQPITLSDVALLQNLQSIQSANNLNVSSELCQDLGRVSLDIEMETGTGKTYVYIKTMFELNKLYGWSKFMVVVPSIAIREGVKKSFDITQDHFMELYGKKARYFVYNSSNLSQIDSFSSSDDISVMIINTQAFNTSFKDGARNDAARIIYSKRDEFGSRRPIDVIKANNPIIILDEPQKMGGAATQAALKQFNPLFTLNYSATHKNVHNPVYVLDALDAFQKKLVKKIEVIGFELKNIMGTNRYLYLEDIILSTNKPPLARIEYQQKLANGRIRHFTSNLAQGDNLYHLSNELSQYTNCVIQEILPKEDKIVLSDGSELHINEAMGNITEEHKARIQIRETIIAHLQKEQNNFHRGIKTLSLFFLDAVKNYRDYDDDGNQLLGRYGKIFEEEYQNIYSEYRSLHDPDYATYLANIEPKNTHAGYFSIDKKGRAIDSDFKKDENNIPAYDLILKNKEQLLSFEEPVRFIFSHSALREGWDNPNVFQICSLRQSNSATQKRQEVGRGLRLCVNNQGIRQDADSINEHTVHHVNKLTVIASEGYASFVNALQTEIKENLYERPKKVTPKFFEGKKLVGLEKPITEAQANNIFLQLAMKGYITVDGEVTQKFRNDYANNTLELLAGDVVSMTESVYKLVQSIFDPSALKGMIESGSKTQVTNRFNDNAKKKEWLELWNKINHKYAYTVSFNSDELIEKSINHINSHLQVSELAYRRTIGGQELKDSLDFKERETKTEIVRTGVVTHVKYDLLGQVAKGTMLTRRTVAAILSAITPIKFNMYRANPEEFISSVIRLINEQKATMIVEHIQYNKVEGEYSMDIFTEEKHKDLEKAYAAEKSIQEYVFTDGYAADGQSVERRLAQDLDKATEVVVYAKLPKGFHIPTPVGNYSPDWAIAFKEGSVQHVYFVAETKGTLDSLQLKPVEQAKIDCASKLFNGLLNTADVRYGLIKDYDSLIKLVNAE